MTHDDLLTHRVAECERSIRELELKVANLEGEVHSGREALIELKVIVRSIAEDFTALKRWLIGATLTSLIAVASLVASIALNA